MRRAGIKKIFRIVRNSIKKGTNAVKIKVIFPLLLQIRRFCAAPYRRAILLLIPFCGFLVFLDFHVFISSREFDWISVVAGAHGFFFDIILLGGFLVIVELFRTRKGKIQKYRDEFEDIYFWNEKEGILKKAGIIRRLSNLGAHITQLSGIVLTAANLDRVNLENAILEGADLTGAKLNNALLNRAVLSGFAETNKKEIILTVENRCTTLTKAEFNNAMICDAECSCIDFSGNQMMHAKLNRSNLRSSIFSGAILRFVEMKNAYLEDADFTNADLYRAEFQESDLQGAVFSKDKNEKWQNGYCAKLTHTHFEGASLNSAVMNHVDMTHVCFKNASLMNTKLASADLGWANLENANLTNADLHDADLSNTLLKNAVLSGVNLRGVKNLTFEQIKEVKTLYQASIDDNLFKEITKKGCNHLFTWQE